MCSEVGRGWIALSCISARKHEMGSGSKPQMLHWMRAALSSGESLFDVLKESKRRVAPARKLPLPQEGSRTRMVVRFLSAVYPQASRMCSTRRGGVEK